MLSDDSKGGAFAGESHQTAEDSTVHIEPPGVHEVKQIEVTVPEMQPQDVDESDIQESDFTHPEASSNVLHSTLLASTHESESPLDHKVAESGQPLQESHETTYESDGVEGGYTDQPAPTNLLSQVFIIIFYCTTL